MTGSPWLAHKLGSWVRSQRARGVSLPQLLLWHLPRMLAGKGTQAIVRVINERVVAAGRDEAHRAMVRGALSRLNPGPSLSLY